MKITDNGGVQYLRVFDLTKKVLIYYIEGSKFLISGDRQFVWNLETNEVYDIINGLSTYFLWPGELINTHAYEHLDLFIVNEDRTIMSTQGSLYLAFNYLSMMIDEELSGESDLR